jgi:hypothetical protein
MAKGKNQKAKVIRWLRVFDCAFGAAAVRLRREERAAGAFLITFDF